MPLGVVIKRIKNYWETDLPTFSVEANQKEQEHHAVD